MKFRIIATVEVEYEFIVDRASREEAQAFGDSLSEHRGLLRPGSGKRCTFIGAEVNPLDEPAAG